MWIRQATDQLESESLPTKLYLQADPHILPETPGRRAQAKAKAAHRLLPIRQSVPMRLSRVRAETRARTSASQSGSHDAGGWRAGTQARVQISPGGRWPG